MPLVSYSDGGYIKSGLLWEGFNWEEKLQVVKHHHFLLIPLKPFLNPLNSSYLLLSNVKIHTLLNPISLIFLSFLIMILVIFSAFIIIYTGWMIYQVRSAESN